MSFPKLLFVISLVGLLVSGSPVRAGLFGFGDAERGTGRAATEQRTLESFEAIESECPADIHITSGSQQTLTITADDNLLDNIKTEVSRRGTLLISSDEPYDSRCGVTIRIVTPQLQGLWLSGSGDITIDELAEKKFDLDLSGSGNIKLNGSMGRLRITLNGSGDIEFQGTADEMDVTVSGSGNLEMRGEASELVVTVGGSGDVKGRHLHADQASVRVNGSGNVHVCAEEYFDGVVYGSGDIDVYGDPRRFHHQESGSGGIHRH